MKVKDTNGVAPSDFMGCQAQLFCPEAPVAGRPAPGLCKGRGGSLIFNETHSVGIVADSATEK